MTATPIPTARRSDAAPHRWSTNVQTGTSINTVSANAVSHDTSAGRRILVLALVAVAALVVAVRLPLEVAVFGVLLFGVPHVMLELRYVYGRFGAGWSRPAIVGTQVLLVGVVVVRFVVPPGTLARMVETSLLGALLVLAVVLGPAARRPRTPIQALVVGAVVLAMAAAMAGIDSWFLVQAHLHNILPLAFLWEWAGASFPLPSARRAKAVLVSIFVGVRLLVLAGGLDAFLPSVGGVLHATGQANAVTRVSATVVPGGVDGVWAARLLVAIAFAQLAHYAVWCWFLPGSAVGREASWETNRGVRVTLGARAGRLLLGWRFGLLIAVSTTAIAVLAWVDFRTGRSTYTSVAAYHALLEYPLLLLLVWRARASPHPVS